MSTLIMEPALPHLPDFIASVFIGMSKASGLPTDQLTFLFALLFAIPLGWIHQLLPSANVKHIFGSVAGIAMLYLNVGPSCCNVVISSSIAYFLTYAFMPSRESLKGKTDEEKVSSRKRVGYIVFVFAMTYMACSHIWRLYVDYLGYTLDFTAAQMMLTLKLASFAWSRVDGENSADGITLDANPREHQYRLERSIPTMPTVIEFFGWTCFFPTLVAGPAIEYCHYRDHINGDRYRRMGITNGRPVFSYTAPLMKLVHMGLVYPGMALAGAFPVMGYVNTPQFFVDYPVVWQRVVYVTLVNAFSRYKYYFAWYLAEAGCASSGIALSAYDPKTGKAEWGACTNCRALSCEFAASTSELTDNWNIFTSEFLKHQVYMRVTAPPALSRFISTRSFANLVTKFTSALWHGFYPGYYIFFLQIWFIQTFELKIRSFIIPYFSTPNPDRPSRPTLIYPRAYIYRGIMCGFVMGSCAWLGSAFVLLEFKSSFAVLADSYFWYHIIGVLTLIVIPGILKKIRGGKGRKGAAPGAVKNSEEATALLQSKAPKGGASEEANKRSDGAITGLALVAGADAASKADSDDEKKDAATGAPGDLADVLSPSGAPSDFGVDNVERMTITEDGLVQRF